MIPSSAHLTYGPAMYSDPNGPDLYAAHAAPAGHEAAMALMLANPGMHYLAALERVQGQPPARPAAPPARTTPATPPPPLPDMYAEPDGHRLAMAWMLEVPGRSYEQALEHARQVRAARTCDPWGRPVGSR